jgi:hypothetical protein
MTEVTSVKLRIPQTGDEVIIETDLTEEEKAIVREGRKHYREHPEDFFTLDYVLAHEDEFRPKKAARARFRKPAGKTAGPLDAGRAGALECWQAGLVVRLEVSCRFWQDDLHPARVALDANRTGMPGFLTGGMRAGCPLDLAGYTG